MAERKITVDGKTYKSKSVALNEFLNAMLGTDGSEQSRMTFAYTSILAGRTKIDTYKEIAI